MCDFLMKNQDSTGAYRNGHTHYTSVVYIAKSFLELAEAERGLSGVSPIWESRYQKHFSSAGRAIDELVLHRDDIQTEGEMTYEDGMIACSYAQISMYATMVPENRRQKYIEAADYLRKGHRSLSQLLIPDSRLNGGSLRYWESQYDILSFPNMMSSPHGWSAWRIYGLWYLYQLTGNPELPDQIYNALGSDVQLIDEQSGVLRWAFCVDPVIRGSILVRDPEFKGRENRGLRRDTIVGEQYINMISDWYKARPDTWVTGYWEPDGGCCDNDVHEIFKCLEEVVLTNACVMVMPGGEIKAYNCRAAFKNRVLEIIPMEKFVNNVNVNNLTDKTLAVSAVSVTGSVSAGKMINLTVTGQVSAGNDQSKPNPKPGDADYPAPSPGDRHNKKVAAIRSGHYDLFLIGNSITETLEGEGEEWKPLRAAWDKYLAPLNAINLGYSGYRTENILWNLQNGELDQARSPRVAMLLIGTNNLDDQHYPKVHSAEEVFAGTKAIVDLIRQRHPTTKILILKIFVCGGPGDETPYHRKYNRSAKCMEAVMKAGELTRQLADDRQVFWLDVNPVFLRPDGKINTDLMPDLIHPNGAGAEAWVKAVMPTLHKLMGNQPGMPATNEPADYVNPFIGASTSVNKAGVLHGLGKTFPGATTPFGLVQLSPNTITGGDNGPGYSYEHKTIEGFAFTQMSGIGWYGDLGNFLVMPAVGPMKTNSGKEDPAIPGYRSAYDKSGEQAKAGYYSVHLTDYDIKAEATAAPHSGMLRFTFPENQSSRIQIDLARRVGGTSTEQYVKVRDQNTIEGWMKCTPDGGGWGNGDGKPDYTVYFYAQFSKPLNDFGVWSANIPDGTNRKREFIESEQFQTITANAEILKQCREKQGKHLGFYTGFPTEEGETVLMKVGISFVSISGARKNLEADITGWDFDQVKSQAREIWNDALSKISVTGGTEEEKKIFYTALYHTLIDPRAFADVDGKYPGGDGKIHQTGNFTKRTIFSGWDVFRSQFPLQTIINPTVVNDMINSLVELADQNDTRYLERWEFLNAYSGCMLGNPAVSVIVDAYAKGIRNFDVARAYEYSRNSVEKFGNGERGYSEDISTTLEHAYSEWCMAEFARLTGNSADDDLYRKRAQSYRNIFDPSVGWFRPKDRDGSWRPWPARGRLEQGYGSVESNPYQQGWFVPHDIEGLAGLLGGREKTIADLTDFFEKSPDNMMWNDYYNHPNEPVHQVPFMFNRLGVPWLTQKWTREICRRAYHDSVEGLVGNEDVGQMSAWYVLAASGLHPVCPGDTRYEITSPVFDRIDIRLDPGYATGKYFTIVARNNSASNIYIQSARLNGKPYEQCRIGHETIIAGGVLELVMGDKPNKDWAAGR
jgi:predicted alpha-1,2-mannosidase